MNLRSASRPVACFGVALSAALGTAHAQAQAQPNEKSWRLRSLAAPTEESRALLLQADGDAAPEWGVFDGTTITVSDISSDYPPISYPISKDATLFDLRDTDRDGKPEIALIREGRLEYWRDATRVAQDVPSITIEFPALAALAFGSPRPHPLFVERRGEDFLSAPLSAEPPLWTLEGEHINLSASAAEETLPLSQFQVWEATTPPAAGTTRTEFRISQRYEQRSDAAPQNLPATRRPAGTRRARDAGEAPPQDWPSFALSGTERVLYALAPPDFGDTLIRLQYAGRADRGTASVASTPRRFPGILIPPPNSGADFNGDGFGDLLFWRAAGSSTSMDTLMRAAQTGTWEVALTVHLYDPATRRFAARPIEWLHAAAPVTQVIEGSVRGPFSYLAMEDIDGDGKTDLVCSGAGNEILAWRFTGKRESEPWLRTKLDQPIDGIILTAHVPAYRWLGIARAGSQFHLFALPQH